MPILRSIELMSTDYIDSAFNFYVNPEKCSNPEYFENYIRYSAINDMATGMAVTHVLIEINEETKEQKMLGYITLRNSSFVKDYDGYKIGFPSLEIYILAVSIEVECNGVGKHLIAHSMKIAKEITAKYSGIQYLVLCATGKSKDYYMKEPLNFAEIAIDDLLPRCEDNIKCQPMFLKLNFQ